jgi:hypothetical protein
MECQPNSILESFTIKVDVLSNHPASHGLTLLDTTMRRPKQNYSLVVGGVVVCLGLRRCFSMTRIIGSF